MPAITVRGVSERVHRRLKRQAETHNRSLNGEVLQLLEQAVALDASEDDAPARTRANAGLERQQRRDEARHGGAFVIVVDAMILAYALVEVPGRSAEVERALKKDAIWASPPLWRSELRNVLLKYVRAESEDIPGSDLTLGDALGKMQMAERLVGGRTVEVKTESAYRALAHTVTAWLPARRRPSPNAT